MNLSIVGQLFHVDEQHAEKNAASGALARRRILCLKYCSLKK
jgi:hypothetical protein